MAYGNDDMTLYILKQTEIIILKKTEKNVENEPCDVLRITKRT